MTLRCSFFFPSFFLCFSYFSLPCIHWCVILPHPKACSHARFVQCGTQGCTWIEICYTYLSIYIYVYVCVRARARVSLCVCVCEYCILFSHYAYLAHCRLLICRLFRSAPRASLSLSLSLSLCLCLCLCLSLPVPVHVPVPVSVSVSVSASVSVHVSAVACFQILQAGLASWRAYLIPTMIRFDAHHTIKGIWNGHLYFNRRLSGIL